MKRRRLPCDESTNPSNGWRAPEPGDAAVVVIESDGSVRFLREPGTEALDALGEPDTRRVSHVEPVHRLLRWAFHALRRHRRDDGVLAAFTRRWPCRWQSRLSPVGGPTLGPFARRSAAIAAEIDWINTCYLEANG